MEPSEEIETEMEGIHKERVTIIRKALFRNAVIGNWKEVVRIHEKEPMAHAVKITTSGDTALHMAVSDGQEKIVERLVEVIVKSSGRSKFLRMKNDRNNTALHLAASVGSAKMCECIAANDSKLIGARNCDSETPFLLAAIHGKMDAFICLHSMCGIKKGYSYCRRKDGDNILHCAIAEEYFDLAFYITSWYGDLIFSYNERGLSPLHLLAKKPSAFKSGSTFGWLDRIIYHCIWIDKLKKPTEHFGEAVEKKRKSLGWPENYRTCLNYFQLLRKFAQALSRKESPKNPEGYVESEGAPPHLFEGCKESEHRAQGHELFPSNYDTCFEFIKRLWKVLAIPLGHTRINRIAEEKEKHTWALQLVEEILVAIYLSDNWESHLGRKDPFGERVKPDIEDMVNSHPETNGQEILGAHVDDQIRKGETPILVASKMGLTEMVEKMLRCMPLALCDVNSDGKNLVHLAVETRQRHVYLFLRGNMYQIGESVFRQTDLQGNSALHLAATLNGSPLWSAQGPALQMQREIEWFQLVKDSMHPNFFPRYNSKGKTADQVFTETHKELVEKGSEWLKNTSELCSIAATVVITVAFATTASVPGGVRERTGAPTFEGQPAFFVLGISSLVALCFSVISLFSFLSIYTSQHKEEDFGCRLPMKLLQALPSLLISVVSMLICFFSSHFLVLKDKLKLHAYPMYAVSGLVVTLAVLFQFPWSFDVIRSSFSILPQRRIKIKDNRDEQRTIGMSKKIAQFAKSNQYAIVD